MLKDFDIEKEAQGVDKAVVRNFTAFVENKILEIRFHWSGKGTTNVPKRGTYGPLISAISIDAGKYKSCMFCISSFTWSGISHSHSHSFIFEF